MNLSNAWAVARVFGSLDCFCTGWPSKLDGNWDRGRHKFCIVTPPPGDGLQWSAGVGEGVSPAASLRVALNRPDRGRERGQTSHQTSRIRCPTANTLL